ncbi:glycosyltransferase family 4 protein [Algisphaera agarilytica]|uniref:UDP-GlcNAc:undecaprenyl-phosphate GlcNAc-1-phosphate transferase n=1 Tax=Algisphaera agarilytica TaxID=1385975 RepID=A0A7X0LKU3_9BACT|nr:MraY family glycosyltransferase [Algisphaera agarilytica]MBB6429303.1 UDP-GlcNAc:undecaprenyl-phosphate GlcNAc-1-phosphate transferase [Algisphaera agarilytica]
MNTTIPDQILRAPVTLADFSGMVQELGPFMGVFFVAFFVAIILTPTMKHLAIKNGIVDWPDLKRKNHAMPVAYLGGVAIFIGWVCGVFSSYVVTPEMSISPDGSDRLLLQSFPISILIGAGVITLTGLFDDVYGIRARVKIGGQLFAAAALTWDRIGIDLTETLFNLVGLSPSSTVVYFTATFLVAIFVLGACNAVNLIDGLDGLSSGVVAISMIGFLLIALLVSQNPDATVAALDNPKRIVLCLAAIGAILGFLPYNFNPASIFMGDAGSLLLGFLAVTAILLFGDAGGWSLKLVTASLIVFAVPMTDTSLAIIRRKMRGQPIFSPDNQHLHHLLRRSGLSVKKSVFVMYGAAIVFAVIGVAMIGLDLQWRYTLAIFFVIYGFIMVTAFKYGAYCIAQDKLLQSQSEPDIPDAAPINRPMPTHSGPNGDSAMELSPPIDPASRN